LRELNWTLVPAKADDNFLPCVAETTSGSRSSTQGRLRVAPASNGLFLFGRALVLFVSGV
jgi:hypothetical protein